MADVKISDLVSANVVNKNDLFLLVQDDSSKNVSAGTLFSSITDPTLSGNIFISGPVQTLTGVGTVSITTTRTDLYGGVSAATAAIANGSVLPSTIYLYTNGKSASGRGLQFANGSPFFKTIYVQHINGKINLSLGANATGTLNHAPEDWVGTTGLRPFNDGLYFVKGAAYTFDVSHPTNAGNIIGLSTSIDGTNTLGLEYTAGVTRTGSPGNAGATVEFTPANVSIDQGGRNYLDIPKGVDGQLKVINLVSTNGGQFVISSNIQNNLAIELRRAGDSAFLMYSGNAWILVGSNPGLQTSFSGTSDDIPEGQKLYFTNARARAAISVPDNTLIYNATTGSIRANVLALSNINLGNIIPNSDSISEGAVNLYYSNARVHANLRLASIDALADVDTRTIAPQTGYALIWNGTRWIPNVVTATALTGTVDYSNIAERANVSNTVLSLSNFTTANLLESSSNLYYSNDRVFANLSLANINVLRDVDTVTVAPAYGDALSWNGNTWVPSAINATSALTANLANLVLSLSNFTTANLTEGSRLYYTNARVNAQVESNLRLKANVVDLTTANVTELNNLYYSNDRVYSNISLASINALADVDTLTSPPSAGQALGWNGTAWIPTTVSASNANTATVANTVLSLSNFTTSNIAEGSNLYYTNARVYANVIGLLNAKANVVDLTTANVIETSGNLYFTNARVYANVSPLLNLKANVVDLTTANVIETSGNLYFTNARVYANVIGLLNTKANVVDLTTANIAELNNLYYSNDRVYANISLANINVLADVNAINPIAGQVLSWSGNAWIANSVTIPSTEYSNIANTVISVVAASLNANTANIANLVLTLSNFTTANLAEGSNLYYTNARVNAQVAPNLALKANVVDLTTANVVELNNLYYTNARVNAQVEPNLRLKANVIDLTTANVVELNNLYYTNARVNAQVESNLRLKANVVDLTTANVQESASNLYYTNARVYSNVTERFGSINTNLVPDEDEVHDLGAPGKKWKDLYLSGFSLTLGNTKITSGAGGALSVQGLVSNTSVLTTSITSNIWNTLYTANVIETAGNLYYTNARVNAQVESNLRLKANVVDLTTANVAELNNLYYTNARVRSTLSGGTGVTYNNTSGLISIGQNVSTTSNVTFGALNVTGEINFYGNVTTHSSNNLSISDNMIYLNNGSETSNPDLGFAGNYNDGTYRHAGFFRDATDGKWKVYDNYSPEPDANIFIDTDHASFRLANLSAATFFGNVQGTVSTLSNFTTANLAEGTNLYYTNARVNAQVQSNLALKANVVDLTTANVRELNNLYYSNARVLSNVQQMSINVLSDVDVTGITTNGTLIWNGSTFIAGVASTASEANYANAAGTANVAVFATTANVANTVLSISNFTTANLAEGTNLYYTNARVYANVTPLLERKANVTDLTTANVVELNNLYYSNARVLSNVAQMSINVFADVDISGIGNNGILIWNGTSFVAGAATTATSANFANTSGYANVATEANFANTAGTANVSLVTNFANTAGTANVSLVTNFANTAGYANTATSANFANTAGYANTATSANFANTAGTANVSLVTNFANTAGTANVANTVLSISNFTTSNLAEGTNLYYTNARVYSNVIAALPTYTGNVGAGNVTIGSGTGGSIVGANLISAVNISGTNWQGLYSANVIESQSALYYSNARVLSNVAQMSINVFADVDITGIGNNGILIWNGTSFVAGAATTATSANFANVAGTANVANFANVAGTANVANTVLSISNFTTSNLAEGTDLYYTNARVNAQVEPNLRLKANVTDFTTANVIELNNLYYSNARVLSNVAQMSINVFADVDISNIQPNDTLVWDGTKFIKANAGQSTAIVANVTTTGNVEITRFSTATYSTAKYVYTVKGTSVGYTNKYNSGELLVMHDDTSSFITQYAMMSNDINLDLLSFQAGINNGNVIIYGNVSDPAIQVTVKLTGATYTAK